MHTRVVAVSSDPLGAAIWLKDGRDFTCTGLVTPANLELRFYGSGDVKLLKVSKFGFFSLEVQVRDSEERLAATLEPLGVFFFTTSPDATPEIEKLNAAVQREFERELVQVIEPFPCAQFEFRQLSVGKREGCDRLALLVLIDAGFSPVVRRLRLGARTPEPVRQRRIAEAILEAGGAETVGRLGEILAKFPEVQDISVACFYSTTEAGLTTNFQRFIEYRTTTKFNAEGDLVGETTPVWRGHENTVVVDSRVFGILRLNVPIEKLPTAADRKQMTEAILASSEFKLE
jgi:hypothetical protein